MTTMDLTAIFVSRKQELRTELSSVIDQIMALNDRRVTIDSELSAMEAAETAYLEALTAPKLTAEPIDVNVPVETAPVQTFDPEAAAVVSRDTFPLSARTISEAFAALSLKSQILGVLADAEQPMLAKDIATEINLRGGLNVTPKTIGGALGILIGERKILRTGGAIGFFEKLPDSGVSAPKQISSENQRAVYEAVAQNPGAQYPLVRAVASSILGRELPMNSIHGAIFYLRRAGWLTASGSPLQTSTPKRYARKHANGSAAHA